MILKLIRRNIRGKPFRFLLTCSAVTMGVMFTVGVFVFTDGLRATFGNLSEDIEGSIEYAVRTRVDFGDQDLVATPVDPAVVDAMAGVDGVTGIQPQILRPGTIPIDATGEAQETTGPPNLGANWEDTTSNPRLFIDQGRPPRGAGEFVLDSEAFDDGEFAVGDRYDVITPTGRQSDLTLVGTFFFASPDENLLVGAKIVVFDTATALEYINGGIGYARVTFEIAPDADVSDVLNRLGGVLPDSLELVTGEQLVEEREAQFNDFIDQFRTFLIVFAFIILAVSAFVIFNVFTILIGQRIRELGLLRAIGASGAQVTWALLGEALLVGVFATVVGTGLGIGFGWSLRELLGSLDFGPSGNDLLIKPTTIGAGVIVGIGVTMSSAIAPALRARRISPMAALREDARLTRWVPPLNPALGGTITLVSWGVLLVTLLSRDWQLIIVLGPLAAVGNAYGLRRVNAAAGRVATLAFGGVMMLCSLVLDLGTGPVLALLGVAAITSFLGVTSVSPLLAKPVSDVIARWPLAIMLGVIGVLLILGPAAGFLMLLVEFAKDPLAGLAPLILATPFLVLIALVGRRAVDASFIMGWHWSSVVGGVVVFLLGLIGGVLALNGILGAITGDPADLVAVPIGIALLVLARVANSGLPRRMKANARMARENAGRSPRRTASAAAALMIGLALVSTASVVAASFKATFADILDESITSDWFISPSGGNPEASFSSSLADALETLPEVETVVRFRFGFDAYKTVADDKVRDSSATDLVASLDHLDPDFVELDESMLDRNAIWIHEDMASDLGYGLGSTFDIEFPAGQVETVRVSGIYSDSSIYGNRVVSLDLWRDAYPTSQDQFVSVTTVDGVDEETARSALQEFTDDFPTVNVDTRKEFQDRQADQIDQALIVINVLLMVAIVIALLGIAITLALSVFERTRELGLVRAVGMTAQQMMRMVLFEGASIAAFGGVLGIVLGTAFGAAAVGVMPDDFIRALDIPVLSLVQYLVVAAVAGIGAAIVPARRAARLDVLEAIASE